MVDVENGTAGRPSSGSMSPSAYMGPQKPNLVYKKCICLVNFFKWFPVLFITAVLVWGYYAYVIQLCIFTVDSVILKLLFLLLFHFLYIMTFWSYWQTIFKTTVTVPKSFWLTHGDVDKLSNETTDEGRNKVFENIVKERNLPVQCRNYNGSIRVCEKCNVIKPDRAHHCSVCDACILKMDHHCPWVNNCVSFSNYKFFVMFLGYAFALCLYSSATSLYYFLQFWKGELKNTGKFHILFLFFVSIMFAISLISLFGYHIYLVLLNRSTLESFRFPIFSSGPDKNGFNLGKMRNWCEVFGDNKLLWFVPVSTCLGDGIIYEKGIKVGKGKRRAEKNGGQSHLGQNDYNSLQDTDIEQGAVDQPIKLSSQKIQANFYNSISVPREGNNPNTLANIHSGDHKDPESPVHEQTKFINAPKTVNKDNKQPFSV